MLAITLILLLGCGAIALVLDAQQRRVDRHVAMAIPETRSTSLPSIRRHQLELRRQALYRLVDYKTGLPYDVRPVFVILAGIGAALGIFYGNTFLAFSILNTIPH